MDFYVILDQVTDLLRQRGRVAYRVLKLQFHLDEEYLEALKDELIYSQQLAVDEEDKVLVWVEETTPPAAQVHPSPPPVRPSLIKEAEPGQANTSSAEQVALDAERRQLTVMFCDLVDSTALSGRLDPEDLRTVIRAYQSACTEVIQRFDGHVAQLLGDGLLVYFGYPQAHEDDAQRAVRSALGIVEAIGALSPRFEPDQDIQLAVRLGIHTGLVVVGEMGGEGHREQLALGETPNIAGGFKTLPNPTRS